MNIPDINKKIEMTADLNEYVYIYLLKQDDVVVYVGQTVNIDARIKAHKRNEKEFKS